METALRAQPPGPLFRPRSHPLDASMNPSDLPSLTRPPPVRHPSAIPSDPTPIKHSGPSNAYAPMG